MNSCSVFEIKMNVLQLFSEKFLIRLENFPFISMKPFGILRFFLIIEVIISKTSVLTRW